MAAYCRGTRSRPANNGLELTTSQKEEVMPTEYQVPGVYIEELPSGSRPIQGVGTAMPAFIGFTFTRPEGNIGQPIFVASWNQFVDYFGIQRTTRADGTEVVEDKSFET